MKKIIVLIAAFLIGLVGWYGLVFWMNFSFEPEVSFGTVIGWELILWDTSLSKQIVVYKSSGNLASGYEISSLCNTSSRYIDSYKNLYFFELSYLDESCQSSSIILKKGETLYPQSSWNIEMRNKIDIYDYYLDLPDSELSKMQTNFQAEISKNAIYKNFSSSEVVKYLSFAIGQRKYMEAYFHNSIILEILEAREDKYINPVPGRSFSENISKIPNSGRPYRAGYTDGIHHGWDIDGQIWDKTVALDDGIIVRVVRDFNNATDFSKIVYTNPNEDQKVKNLDVLRGSQVWLKTMKGDIVFYSHLDTIPDAIEEWIMVKKWSTRSRVWWLSFAFCSHEKSL